jgi:hypothetical protein
LLAHTSGIILTDLLFSPLFPWGGDGGRY